MHNSIIKDFYEAWRTLNSELIIKHLSDDFVYDSMWVFASLDSNGYKEYIKGKFDTLRKNGTGPAVEIVSDPYSGNEMLKLDQGGDIAYYHIEVKDGKVIKGDLCAF